MHELGIIPKEIVPVTDPWTGGPTAHIYTDGCAKGNPGPSGIGASFQDEQGQELYAISASVGLGSNNQAEYKAVARALWDAVGFGLQHVHVYSDSQLVVNQVLGKWACRDRNLHLLKQAILNLSAVFQSFTIQYVPRERNTRADRLANEGLYRLE